MRFPFSGGGVLFRAEKPTETHQLLSMCPDKSTCDSTTQCGHPRAVAAVSPRLVEPRWVSRCLHPQVILKFGRARTTGFRFEANGATPTLLHRRQVKDRTQKHPKVVTFEEVHSDSAVFGKNIS